MFGRSKSKRGKPTGRAKGARGAARRLSASVVERVVSPPTRGEKVRLPDFEGIAKKIKGLIRHRAISKKTSPTDAELMAAYAHNVDEAIKHPKMLGEYFLHPQNLSLALRQDIEAHLSECEKCRDIAAYYGAHRDLFSLWKEEPCD